MDTVISNKYDEIFSSLNIEVSKKLNGELEVDEIISTFGNFFFNRMFLDITAIKDYKDLNNLKKLSMSLNMDKIILLLDKDDEISNSKVFLSKLVDMGIYNFTKDSNSLMYLYNNPNTYRDVAYYQDVDKNADANHLPTNNEYNGSKKILGIKALTESAGATTLVYLLKKILSDYYSVMSIEIGKRDFAYLNDKDCFSIDEKDLDSTLSRYSTTDIFLIDLNKSKKEDICTDILYLIEPTTIRLNKLVLVNRNVFSELKGKKVVLSRSLLDDSELADFEVESGIKVYYSIPPLNDKKNCSQKLLPLLEKLGYVKTKEEDSSESKEKKKGLFSFFK